MDLTPDEMARLRKVCDELEDGPDYRCDDYVDNLLNTALDFYMRSESAAKAISYSKRTHGIENHQQVKNVLAKYPNTKEGNRSLARFLWNNDHWSRAKFLRKIVQFFDERGVTDQQGLEAWVHGADFDRDMKNQLKTDEHSIGYTLFQWLRVRCGVNTVKPDLRVISFITAAIGRKVTPAEAVASLERIASDSARRANRLDSAIWLFMEKSSRSSEALKNRVAEPPATRTSSRGGNQMPRPIVDPSHIRTVLTKLGDRRFNTLEFANLFKTSFPEDWETLVSRYGNGGIGNGNFYSPYSYLGQRLRASATFERWVEAPEGWGNSIIALWKN